MEEQIKKWQRRTASPRAAAKRFLIGYLCSAAVFTAAVKGVLVMHASADLAALKAREAAKVAIAGNILERRLEIVAADLRVLAHTSMVESLAGHDDALHRERTARLFSIFSREKQIYDQIRYLNAAGKEVVRVDLEDGKPVVVPDAQLQDKSGRYFFQDAIRLRPGEIYVSPFDLSVENGRIVVPYKPMVRLATPVFDEAGEHHGVMLLNLRGDMLLDRFRQLMGTEYAAMLLNRDGDWLVAPDPSLEWGFMFGRPQGFARSHPAAWQAVTSMPRGSWLDEEGLFTYATVFPLQGRQRSATGSPLPVGASEHELDAASYFWKVVSLVPAKALPSADIFAGPLSTAVYAGGLIVLLVLAGYLSYVVGSRHRLHLEVLQNAKRFKEITDNLGEGLLVLDRDGRIVEANPEAEKLLGRSRRELAGQDAHAAIHHPPEHGVPLEQCAIRKVAISGVPYRSEDEAFIRKDGTQFPVGLSAAPLTCEGDIVGSVVAFRDITEIKRQQEEIRQLAYHDTLTGLPNRRMLTDHLDLALGLARRYRRSLALLFLDLDHFKQINDTYGHEGGDELLKGLSARLCQVVRQTDTISRQGGDEFVILLAEIEAPEDAAFTARKILRVLSEPLPVMGRLLPIGVSIGIAVYPDDADTADALMQKADSAMYAAKQAGRNRYCLSGAAPRTLDDADMPEG